MTHFFCRDSQPWDLLECIAESVHQGITVVNKDLNLVVVNRTARELLDLPENLLKGKTALEDIFRFNAERGEYGPGDPEVQVRERLEQAKMFVAHDFVRERPNGIVLRIQGTPMPDGGFVTIYTDVTDAQKQHDELRGVQQRLEGTLEAQAQELQANRDLMFNAFNSISDGLGITAKDGTVVLANDKMREIYPAVDEIIANKGTVSDVLRSVFPDEPERPFDNASSDPSMWTERQFPDGRWYKVTRVPSNDGGMISVYSDITFYKEQHALLRQHADELIKHLRQEKKLSEMQREFVSMASHEFRTPLAIIDSNAQRLKRKIDKLDPEVVVERVDKIRESVDRMQYLINRFLNFSQSQSGEMELQIEPTPLRELAQSVCARQQSVAKKHTIHSDFSELPEMAEIDRKLIEQCLSNILSNAVKYSAGKKDVYVVGKMDGDYAVISVQDEGVGIPEKEIPRIFNRYFRASTSSGIAGTGIGLNMTEMIVEKHSGEVAVESVVGEGTKVTIRLPLKAKASAKRKRTVGVSKLKKVS